MDINFLKRIIPVFYNISNKMQVKDTGYKNNNLGTAQGRVSENQSSLNME